jgi:hypothetical protein
MLILRGRANRMFAPPNGSVPRLTRACVSLACAAVTLSLSPLHALSRHAAVPHAHAVAHVEPASHSAAKHPAGRSKAVAIPVKQVRGRSESRVPVAAVSRQPAAHRAGKATPVVLRSHGRHAIAEETSRVSDRHVPGPPMPSMRMTISRAATEQPKHAAVAPKPTQNASDTSAEDRVHAWYQARAAAESAPAASVTNAVDPTSAKISAPAKPVVAAKTFLPANIQVAKIDIPKAAVTSPAAAVNSSNEDDAAAIHEESSIPSTAPTERVPAPFAHGDLLAATPPTTAGIIKPHAATPPALAGALPPALHGPAPAAKAVAAASAKPKLDPELADAMTREAFDDSDAVGLNSRSATALVGSTANTKLAQRPSLAVLDEAPGLRGDLFNASDRSIAPMRGTHMILVHQNQMAVDDGLLRIENDRQMADMQRHKLLVALPDDESIEPNSRLPLNRRYARPWTVHFLNDLARAHYARFHTPLIVTSAARTVAFQRHLVQVNGNAAPPTGDIASPHLYGQAIDLAKHGMSITEIAWMRAYLTPVENDGKIDVEEEFLQSCFHISVYRRYAPQPAQRETPAIEEAPSRRLQQAKAVPTKRRHISTALLAAGLR